MNRRRLLLAAALFLLTFLASPPAAFSGTKLDLSPYLGQLRMPGDFKVYTWDTGAQRTVTVLETMPWSKGWAVLVGTELTGTPDGDSAWLSESYLIPGKQLLTGGQDFGSYQFLVAKPAKGLKLFTTLGKVQRIKAKATLVANGQAVGAVLRVGAWVAEDFEKVETPSGTYPGALRARSSSGIRIVDAFGGDFVYFYDETLWYAETFGLVKVETHLDYYEHGIFVEERDWMESLSSGSLGGVPFP